MRLSDWLQKRKWLFVSFAVASIFIASKPVLWPDGIGIRGETSTTTTVEKNKRGKIVKTVETTSPQAGKTLWDWLSLLGVPLSLAALGYWLQQQEKQRDEATAKAQREVAEDASKEEALQVYFDRISALFVDKNLRAIVAKVKGEEVENSEIQKQETVTDEQQELLDASVDMIRARTLSILRRFENDGKFKGIVIQFLIEAEIINKLKLSLSFAGLSNADLNNADLSWVNLSNTDLQRAVLSNADLRGAVLSNADLSNASLSNADLSNAYLSNAILKEVDLSRATLISVNLSNAVLSNAILKEVDLRNANLNAADLSSVNLSSANMEGASLMGAVLSGADLSNAYLGKAVLNFANLAEASLNGANLTESSLTGANLNGANLTESYVIGASLIEVDLSGANLSSAVLNGTNLSKAKLNKANLSKAKFDKNTVWPDPAEVAKAINISEELRKQLGIPTTGS